MHQLTIKNLQCCKKCKEKPFSFLLFTWL